MIEVAQLSEESKIIVRDRLLNDVALIQAWASLIATDVECETKFRAESILRLLGNYEFDIRTLLNVPQEM